MNKVLTGIICGLFFGILTVIMMVPLKYGTGRKKCEAILGAFIERFMIGLVIPNVNLGAHPALTGLVIGFGLSLPSAIISRAYAPIIIVGTVGGVIIGFITNSLL